MNYRTRLNKAGNPLSAYTITHLEPVLGPVAHFLAQGRARKVSLAFDDELKFLEHPNGPEAWAIGHRFKLISIHCPGQTKLHAERISEFTLRLSIPLMRVDDILTAIHQLEGYVKWGFLDFSYNPEQRADIEGHEYGSPIDGLTIKRWVRDHWPEALTIWHTRIPPELTSGFEERLRTPMTIHKSATYDPIPLIMDLEETMRIHDPVNAVQALNRGIEQLRNRQYAAFQELLKAYPHGNSLAHNPSASQIRAIRNQLRPFGLHLGNDNALRLFLTWLDNEGFEPFMGDNPLWREKALPHLIEATVSMEPRKLADAIQHMERPALQSRYLAVLTRDEGRILQCLHEAMGGAGWDRVVAAPLPATTDGLQKQLGLITGKRYSPQQINDLIESIIMKWHLPADGLDISLTRIAWLFSVMEQRNLHYCSNLCTSITAHTVPLAKPKIRFLEKQTAAPISPIQASAEATV